MLKHWLAPLGLRGRGSRGATAGGSMLTLAGLGSTHVTPRLAVRRRSTQR